MSLSMNTSDYVDYLLLAGLTIAKNKDYVTALDSKTGDGDHWVNLNMGFEKISYIANELRELELDAMFRKIGMTMMSAVGGSSGVLYGSAYLEAAKEVQKAFEQNPGKERVIDIDLLYEILNVMEQAIMNRGKAEPGFKTMLDSLHQARIDMGEALHSNADEAAVIEALKAGARKGMESTRLMEAVKGRASYQTDKGVGELDPGAVTMCMQLECLADSLIKNSERN